MDVHRVEFEVDWPPFHAAAYLVDAVEPVLVDAGGPGERGWTELTAGLTDAGFAAADVEHLLVTHPHTDHDGQVARLVDAADPTVYALESARDRLRMDADLLAARVRSNAAAAGVDEDGVEEHADRAVSSLERNRGCFPPDCVDRTLAPGESFEAGGVTFETVHTPGHQRDHACFAAGDRLFAGDQVIEPFRAAALNVGLDDEVFDSVDEFYAGYRRLARRSFDRVYPGHGPVFEGFADALADSVASLDSLVAETADALDTLGNATPADVNAERVDEQRDYTLFETVGALGHLDTAGHADHTVEDGVRRYAPTDG
ncbi:MBL fold metallo-hydrolase [Halorarius halobius]|uniref:MBL fold metallo-hydrolase n=1 Tax=Halorarius halobius TaxID=2962671 RepID=UPI0020CBB24B|nr:MBL fold metallo-hydrolase [Halorarius halobius]